MTKKSFKRVDSKGHEEIWEWNEVCFLVLEYCEGGELFHYIIEKKFLSEEVAAFIMK